MLSEIKKEDISNNSLIIGINELNDLSPAIKDAGDGVHEDVLAWYLKADGDNQTLIDNDMTLIQEFRSIMVDINN